MTTVRIELPPKLIPVFAGETRYRGSYGGRGSAKTRSFAKMTAVKGHQFAEAGREGIILCGRQFMNSLDESSLEEVKAAIRSEEWLEDYYEIGEKFVRTKNGRVAYKFAGLDRNLDSIKSKARILLNWNDEAEAISEAAWQKLIPTVREDESEIWVTWNPERKGSATDKRFRLDPPSDAKIIEMNWRDNPWFPAVLKRERLEDMEKRPETYEHIWEGEYATVSQGAYYAAALTKAKAENRIGKVAADPLMALRAYWDIGGTGAKADATAIWIVQFVGREIRVLDYYEAQGQELSEHLAWLRKHHERAQCFLPHDGASNDKVYRVSFESAIRSAGFPVQTIQNAGKGAASQRVEAVRRLFPSIWFNEATTQAGRESLGWYHERIDDKRQIGLGPEHDWSSHAADAFGLMAMDYEAPREKRKPKRPRQTAGAWMG